MSAEVTTPAGESRRGLLRGLWLRFEGLIRELGKFGAVGGIAFVVDTLMFNLFLHPFGHLGAKAGSTVVSATVAFVGNRFWTWRHRSSSALRQEYLRYFAFNVVGLLIGEACLSLSHDGLGHFWPEVFHTSLADNIAGQIAGTAFGTLFRFWAYRRFVFPEAGEPVATVAATDTVLG